MHIFLQFMLYYSFFVKKILIPIYLAEQLQSLASCEVFLKITPHFTCLIQVIVIHVVQLLGKYPDADPLLRKDMSAKTSRGQNLVAQNVCVETSCNLIERVEQHHNGASWKHEASYTLHELLFNYSCIETLDAFKLRTITAATLYKLPQALCAKLWNHAR